MTLTKHFLISLRHHHHHWNSGRLLDRLLSQLSSRFPQQTGRSTTIRHSIPERARLLARRRAYNTRSPHIAHDSTSLQEVLVEVPMPAQWSRSSRSGLQAKHQNRIAIQLFDILCRRSQHFLHIAIALSIPLHSQRLQFHWTLTNHTGQESSTNNQKNCIFMQFHPSSSCRKSKHHQAPELNTKPASQSAPNRFLSVSSSSPSSPSSSWTIYISV